MSEWICARCVLAEEPGASVDIGSSPIPPDCTLMTGADIEGSTYLAPPAEAVQVLPRSASYRGEPIGVLTGPDWNTIDRLRRSIEQVGADAAAGKPESAGAPEARRKKPGRRRDIIHETTGTTAPQLHLTKEAMWVQAKPLAEGCEVIVPTQWPAHVVRSVAAALGTHHRNVSVVPVAPGITRDAAALFPSLLATLAALVAKVTGGAILLSTTIPESYLSGGRTGHSATWRSVLDENGRIREASVATVIDFGAYQAFTAEIDARATAPHNLLYGTAAVATTLRTSRQVPLALFEGLFDSEFAFGRELHANELCGARGWDPIEWRLMHLEAAARVAGDVLKDAAGRADFRRRYAANRARLNRESAQKAHGPSTRGVGIALAAQQCGFVATLSDGSISVRLEQDGIAVLRCSLPAANPELKRYWRQLVATHLDIDESDVLMDDEFNEEKRNTGPAILSRGVSIVPRAIRSACDAIRRQRFRAPLPIEVSRSVRIPKSGKTPADVARSFGAAVVETEFHPSTAEFDIRSVHISIYAGAVVNRSAAESEIRRGVFQALAWALHEGAPPDGSVVPGTGWYDTTFRGRLPRVSISFVEAGAKDVPSGVAELPFATVPAATVSALAQATGVPIRAIPVDLPAIIRAWGQP